MARPAYGRTGLVEMSSRYSFRRRIFHERHRGSGSHGTLYLGRGLTVVNDLKKELGPGLLSDMCKRLRIRKEDL